MHTLSTALTWAGANWYWLLFGAGYLLDWFLGRNPKYAANGIVHAVEIGIKAALATGPAGTVKQAAEAAKDAALRSASGTSDSGAGVKALLPFLLVAGFASACATPYTTARASLAGIAVADTGAYLAVQAYDRPKQEALVAEVKASCKDLPTPVCASNTEARLAAYRHERDVLLDMLHAVESAIGVAQKAVDEAEAHKLDPLPLVGPVLDLWTQGAKVAGDFGVKVPTVNDAFGAIGGAK